MSPVARRDWREVLVPGRSVAVSVPASTGNVGPGFDTLGLALEHRDEIELTVLESGLELSLIHI